MPGSLHFANESQTSLKSESQTMVRLRPPPQPRRPENIFPTSRPAETNFLQCLRHRTNLLNHIGPECWANRPRRRPTSCTGRQRSSSNSRRTAARSHGRLSRCKRRAILPTTACPGPACICHNNMAVVPSISAEALADRNRDNSAWTLCTSFAKTAPGF